MMNLAPRRSSKLKVQSSSEAPDFKSKITRGIFGALNLKLLLSFELGIMSFSTLAAPVENDATLRSWLAAQTNLHTWNATVTQTRTLKTLTQPLVATGQVWFAEPNRFRWEIGQPAQTIAVRQPDQMLVIYPRLKRAEIYPLNDGHPGPWKDTLALLEAGFPRSRAELEDRFRVVSQITTNDVCELTLQPRSAAARRLMPELKIFFSTTGYTLRATELQFADSSRMRNDFTAARLNPKLEEILFTPVLPDDFKIVEPAKRPTNR